MALSSVKSMRRGYGLSECRRSIRNVSHLKTVGNLRCLPIGAGEKVNLLGPNKGKPDSLYVLAAGHPLLLAVCVFGEFPYSNAACESLLLFDASFEAACLDAVYQSPE
jgi:hypothetical protein